MSSSSHWCLALPRCFPALSSRPFQGHLSQMGPSPGCPVFALLWWMLGGGSQLNLSANDESCCTLQQGPKVKQFMDIFSIPEMILLAVANDFFITNDIDYDPVHLSKDVSVSIHIWTVECVKVFTACVNWNGNHPALWPRWQLSALVQFLFKTYCHLTLNVKHNVHLLLAWTIIHVW